MSGNFLFPDTRYPFPEGAIAQLGERLLCKQEVVGSIPSGSTSRRSRCELRLGKPIGNDTARDAKRVLSLPSAKQTNSFVCVHLSMRSHA